MATENGSVERLQRGCVLEQRLDDNDDASWEDATDALIGSSAAAGGSTPA